MKASAKGLTVLVRAFASAKSAARTVVLRYVELLFGQKSLGVMTPDASERTSLEKNGSPYTASVVYGKLLDIEYQADHKLYS